MAKSWQYPKWRRFTMQAVLWLILAGTVGLAALVTRQKERASRIPMGEAIDLDGISIRLPIDWAEAGRSQRGTDQTIYAQERATGASEGSGGRRIEITRRRLEAPISPHEYLLRYHRLPGLEASNDVIEHGGGFVQFGRYPGIMATATLQQGGARRGVQIKDIIAAATLPTLDAVSIHLQGYGPLDYYDEQLVRQIAATLVVETAQTAASAEKKGEKAGALVIGGARVNLPKSFKLLAETDPNVVERHAIRGESERLVSLTLVPCVFFPKEGPEQIPGLMAARGVEWWRCGPTVEARGTAPSDENATTPNMEFEFAPVGLDEPYRTRAFLKADASGQALLAIFHGLPSEIKDCEEQWDALVKTLEFDKDMRPEQWLKVGASESRRILGQDMREFVGNPTEEWWIWRHMSSGWNFGWTHATYTRPGAAMGTWDLRWREAPGHVGQVKLAWELKAPTAYARSLERRALEKGLEAMEVFRQDLTVDRGRFTATMRPLKPSQWRAAISDQYVAGAYLPLVLGKLENKWMLLRSDTAAGCESLPMIEPWLLVIRPETAEATTAPSDAKDAGLRCVTLEVNGSGRRSRWYFRQDGTLAHVDFAGGTRRLRSDARDVQELFGDESDMRVR